MPDQSNFGNRSDMQQRITAKRRDLVLELKKAGLTYEEIAEQIKKKYEERDELDADELPKNYDKNQACQDVNRELEKYREEVHDKREAHVMLAVERCEKIIKTLWKTVRHTNSERMEMKAVDRIIKAMKRKSEYLGLDSPEELVLVDQTEEQTDSFQWANPDEAPQLEENGHIIHGDSNDNSDEQPKQLTNGTDKSGVDHS